MVDVGCCGCCKGGYGCCGWLLLGLDLCECC